jgi:hypothetical protein
MSTFIQEGDIEFEFESGWNVVKYDESPEYLHGIARLEGVWKTECDGRQYTRGTKAVDILGLRESELMFLEVKNFRRARIDHRARIRDELPLEVGFKVCDTIAGVVGCSRGASNKTLRTFAKKLATKRATVMVILYLEEPPTTNDFELKRRKARLGTITNKVKEKCSWLTTAVLVVNDQEVGNGLKGIRTRESEAGRC